MANESKPHRTEANVYSIESRMGDESGDRSGLDGRRSHKAERLIGSERGLVSLILESFQKIENDNES
jgi:hypothetical protein